MNKEFLKMQKLAGLITESQFQKKLNEVKVKLPLYTAEQFLLFLNKNKDEIFDKIYSDYVNGIEDISNLKEYYKFIELDPDNEFPWYGASPDIPLIYNDPRHVYVDSINIAQREQDFTQDFDNNADMDGEERPVIYSKNIAGKNIYYSIFSW
jgi:hypothetical protein